jgi:peptidoglycan/xylan/chitin deacetylase (PgdA/CDA1 family)
MAKILLSFDLEEFDLPEEFGVVINSADQLKISHYGLIKLIDCLTEYKIAVTHYTTAFFAQHFPDLIRDISQKHEIASHGVNHSKFEIQDLADSKKILENITQKKITGFRMPKMKYVSDQSLKDSGYIYNASLNPTWLPGRYNKLLSPRKPFYKNGLYNLPSSTTFYHFPLFWISFKNIPYAVFKKMAIDIIRREGYLHLYFHPWEFSDLSSFAIPNYIKKIDGQELFDRFNQLILDIRNEGEFITATDYISQLEIKD